MSVEMETKQERNRRLYPRATTNDFKRLADILKESKELGEENERLIKRFNLDECKEEK